MKANNEHFFGPEAAPSEPLELDQVRDLLYAGIDPKKRKKPGKNGDVEEWALKMKCFQDWFIRCSWTNKFLFLEILCYSTEGCLVVEKILRAIDKVFTKDIVESLSTDFTTYVYDKIPADDNRTLDRSYLMRTMKNDFMWFVNLDPGLQSRVILKLLRLGGGGLVLGLYKTAQKIFSERQEIYRLLSTVPDEKSSKAFGSPDSRITVTDEPWKSSDSSANLSLKKFEQLVRWQDELSLYKKSRNLSGEEERPSKKEVPEGLDHVQILPLSLNRKIMSYVDAKSLPAFKKVGKYWTKMIDESINEISGRKAINGKITKIRGTKFEKKEKIREKKDEDEIHECVAVSKDKTLINSKIQSNAFYSFREGRCDSWTLYQRIFSKKFSLKELDTYSYPGRQCVLESVVGTLACSSPYNTVHFYSIRTGEKLDFTVFGFETTITCLALHPNRKHIFVGCRNGSIMARDMRTNKKAGMFAKHSKALISLFTTDENLLSSSEDNTIYIFQLWSGVCLLCVDFGHELNISCALLTKDKSLLSVIGTLEGVLILLDVKGKICLNKLKLHKDEIRAVVLDGDILVTGSGDGRIRIWDMKNLDRNIHILKPFYDVDVKSPVASLTLFKNQIFSGCDDGTLKIISLATGNVFKIMKISFGTPILGSAITDYKASVKLVIWHEGGIEVRTFSLVEFFCSKKSKRKESGMRKTPSEMVFASFAKSGHDFMLTSGAGQKTTVFSSRKSPLDAKCCTLSALRKRQKNARKFNTSAFTEIINQTFALPFHVETFPRYKNSISNKK